MRKNTALILMFGFIGGTSCRKDEITSVEVPKETAPVGPLPISGEGKEIHWTVPSSWREEAPSQMRVGSFKAKTPGGEEVGISVVPLSGEAGGRLANINRWRGQIQLPPLSEADLASNVKTIRPSGREMAYIEFSNQGRGLAAAIYEREGQTWFFKMMGEEKAVESQKEVFSSFLEGLRFNAHE